MYTNVFHRNVSTYFWQLVRIRFSVQGYVRVVTQNRPGKQSNTARAEYVVRRICTTRNNRLARRGEERKHSYRIPSAATVFRRLWSDFRFSISNFPRCDINNIAKKNVHDTGIVVYRSAANNIDLRNHRTRRTGYIINVEFIIRQFK